LSAVRWLDVTLVHSAQQLGSLTGITVEGTRAWAVGGTYDLDGVRPPVAGTLYDKPACLYSHDGGHAFVQWSPPAEPGLRDVYVDDGTLWVVGELGMIATTTDGASWNIIEHDETACLFAIRRDANRHLWILGDDGVVLRSRTGERYERVANLSTGRVLNLLCEPTSMWLMDSNGLLQRTTPRGELAEVPLGVLRARRPLTALVRTVARTLLLIGDGGLILRSTTDGAWWHRISIDSHVDLEKIILTRYGIFVVGDDGALLVSHDDGRSFQGLETAMNWHLWSIAEIAGDLLIGGDRGRLWRIDRAELALLLRAAFEHRDPVIAELASRVHEGDEGAELVLDDALRERELW
jgi:hypothetical protein